MASSDLWTEARRLNDEGSALLAQSRTLPRWRWLRRERLREEAKRLMIAAASAAAEDFAERRERCVTCGASSEHWQPQHRPAR
jgi:hypothetical protein